MLLPVLCRRWWEWRSWSVLSRLVAVGWCIDAWTPLKAHSPWSACTPQYCPPLLTQKMSSTRILQQQSWPSPAREQLVLLGHFSARVGADNDSWPSRLGPFGVGKMNWNGQRLLELCALQTLCITNSFFKAKLQHKVSWRHPRSRHWHQLDLILVRLATIKNVLKTRSYHSTDCDTDHFLVCCMIRL